MANLTPTASWDDVFQLEVTTAVLGGPGGPANLQAQALLNRFAFLEGQSGATKVGVKSSTTGSATRTLAAKLNDTLNVNDMAGVDPTGAISSSAGINAALSSGAFYVRARGTYLLTTPLLIPDEVIFDCRGATFLAGANNLTMLQNSGVSSYFGQIWGGIWNGNGRTGVVGMDLNNVRINAGVFSPSWRNMEVGLISRNGCFGMVIDNPGSIAVPYPIRVLANASTMVIRNPSLDNSSLIGGNGTGIGVDIRAGAGDNIGVRIDGGYIQGFDSGIKDAGIKTIVDGTYVELNTYDIEAVGARASRYTAMQLYGPSGTAGFRLRNCDAVHIVDPTMASGGRTGLFDVDGTNTNCVGFMAGSNAALNTPLGTVTGLHLTDYTTQYVATDASGAGLTLTANRQGYRTGHGLRLTLDVDITYPVTANGSNAAINLPVAARAGALVSGACGFTDFGGYVGIAGSGSTINFFNAAGAALTNANLSGRRLQFSLSYLVQ